jgi:hypothetical protein
MADSEREMEEPNVRRSQAILRMPVDYVDATLILDDGERSEVIFFVPPGEGIARMVAAGDAFIPVMREAKVCIVARAAIACVGVAAKIAGAPDAELPHETQRVAVKLRGGTRLEGELTWPVVEGKQRTADYLNSTSTYFVLHAGEVNYFILKAHVATVQEL